MFDDLIITMTAEEAPANGANLTAQYENATVTGSFSLAAVASQVNTLKHALQQGVPGGDDRRPAGADLFDALFAGTLFRTYTKASTLAKERGRVLRLRINTQIPALVAVPWEYLYDRDLERWLALDAQISLVRSLPVAAGTPLPVDGALRVAVMISKPVNLPQFDGEREWSNLQAIAETAAIELIPIDPTYEALQAALRQAPHVFHFVGHGALDEASQEGMLALCDSAGRSRAMRSGDLATLLSNCQSLRLVVLSACQGATPAATSAFGGLAQKLIQQGTPAVIAMQAPVIDDHAMRFAQEFYRALADGYGLEAAVGEGRKRINEVAASWGVPTLYFQGSEPFAITALSDAQKAERLWQKAQQVTEPERRRGLLERILALAPKHTGATAARQQLQNSAEAERLYAEALPLIEQAAWRDAYRALETVERLSPNYADTRSLLAELLGKLGAPSTAVPAIAPGSDEAQRQRFQPILNALQEGRLVPFLGWDLGRVGRPPQDGWAKGYYLPGADEIASFLNKKLSGDQASSQSLLQVSQATSLTDGPEALYERLNELFNADYPPTILHRLLAEAPMRLAAKGYPQNKPDHRFVYFSTAFDTLLEQAFVQAGQPYHLFAYRQRTIDGSGRVQEGRFVHFPPGAGSEPLELVSPNTYNAHDIGPDGQPDRRPIIVKLCGLRVTADVDSVVVTEDQFLDYLPAQEIGALLPPTLLQQVRKRSFVFFGFSLYEWHFRLIWQRMKWQKASLHGRSWAILANPSAIEQQFWRSQQIEPLTAAPEAVAATVNNWLDTL